MPETHAAGLPEAQRFHHIGYACAAIARDRAVLESIGYTLEADHFEDPVQGVRGCFMVGAGPRIELLENLPGSSTLTPWIEARIKMYHLAYEVADLDVAIARARGQGALLKVPPVAAVAFGGRRIAFVFFRNGLMTEFVEAALSRPHGAEQGPKT